MYCVAGVTVGVGSPGRSGSVAVCLHLDTLLMASSGAWEQTPFARVAVTKAAYDSSRIHR
jgi:hypothetical protein